MDIFMWLNQRENIRQLFKNLKLNIILVENLGQLNEK